MKQAKDTLKQIRRSPYQAIAAALAMSLTFFVASIFIILIFGGQLVLLYLEQRPQVIAFFSDETKESRILEIAKEIETTGLSKEIKYVSKEEAYEIYRERFKDDPLLLESVTADFLPAHLEVSAQKVDDIKILTEGFRQREEVESIVAPEDVVGKLANVTRTVRAAGLIFVSVLIAISFLIIIMVVGMRIALRRDEISIMNLVGATRWYIAKPFFIEGALYGIIGASIATFLVYSLLLFYSPQIQNFLGPIQIFPISPLFFLYLWLAQVTAAITVGVLGAAIALYRYLRVK